jgi:hypothetical protein
MTIRTHLKAGGHNLNHNEALQVRTALKGGRPPSGDLTGYNHNETLKVRTALKGGGSSLNHNEALQRATDRGAVSMRRELLTTSRKEDRLELLVVRAGLRAGVRRTCRVARD